MCRRISKNNKIKQCDLFSLSTNAWDFTSICSNKWVMHTLFSFYLYLLLFPYIDLLPRQDALMAARTITYPQAQLRMCRYMYMFVTLVMLPRKFWNKINKIKFNSLKLLSTDTICFKQICLLCHQFWWERNSLLKDWFNYAKTI